MTRTNAIIRSISKRNERITAWFVEKDGITSWPPQTGYAWKLAGAEKLMLADPTGSMVATDDKLMSATFIISTTAQDRDGDIMISKGCSLDNYKRNPVVFYNHQQNPIPIGKAVGPDGKLAVSLQPDRIVATCYFDQQDPDAAYIYGKVKRGFLSATSIGFIPLEGEQIASKAKPGSVFQREGWLFKRWELLEFSVVGVPANPEALMLDDLDTARISTKLRKALQPYSALTPKAHLLPVTEKMKRDSELITGIVGTSEPGSGRQSLTGATTMEFNHDGTVTVHPTTAAEEAPVAEEKQYDEEPDDAGADSEEKQMPLGAQCLMELAAHIQAKLPQLEPGIAVRRLYEKILPMLAAAAARDYPDLDLGIEMAEDEEEEEPKKEEKKSHVTRAIVDARTGAVVDWSPVLKEMSALRRELRIATGRVD